MSRRISLTQEQLEVSTLEPHHKTSVYYPEPDILEDLNDAIPVMLPALQAEKRYEPLPLVDMPAIEHHAYRHNDNETSFFVLHRVDPAFESPWPRTNLALSNPAQARLSEDMAIATKNTGTTDLFVQLYRLAGDADQKTMIRIARESSYPIGIGAEVDLELAFYSLTLEQFRNLRWKEFWYLSVLDLVFARSDRAVRHVKRNAEYQAVIAQNQSADAENQPASAPPISNWLPRRRPKYHRLVGQVSQPAKLADIPDDENARTCIICTTNWADNAPPQDANTVCDPTRLPCGHLVGLQCMSEWVASSQAEEKVGCPYCRKAIFPTELLSHEAYREVKMGLEKGVFYPDQTYSAWENFERSVADLDIEEAKNCNGHIVVDIKVLQGAWNSILKGACREGENSTPIHLQPQFFPELVPAEQAVVKVLRRVNGHRARVRELWAHIIDQIYKKLFRVLASAPANVEAFRRNLSPDEWMDCVEDPSTARAFPNRPGFREFVERTVSRMLMFAMLRKCNEHADAAPQSALHRHGLRLHYR